GVHQFGEIEVAHFQATGAADAVWAVDDAEAHRLHAGQIVVERSGGVRSRINPQSLAQVRLDRPVVGSAAHRYAGQKEVGPFDGRLPGARAARCRVELDTPV